MAKTRKKKSARATPGGEGTREALLNAGLCLFARKGYDGTSVKDIVNKAGVNICLVSYHFNGKEGLYRSCLEHFSRKRSESAERILQEVASFEELSVRLRMMVEEMIRGFIDNPDLHKMILRDIELDNPITMEVFKEHLYRTFQLLVTLLENCQKKAILREDVDPLFTASFLNGMVLNLVRTDHIGERFLNMTIRDPKVREKAIDHIMRIYVANLAPQPQRKSKTGRKES